MPQSPSTELRPHMAETLKWLCRLPFADAYELISISLSGVPARTVYDRLAVLRRRGLVMQFNHSVGERAWTRRQLVSADGIGAYAAHLGIRSSDLVKQHPISREWLGLIADRIDNVAQVYRLASLIADTMGDGPVAVNLRRNDNFDAYIAPWPGRAIGVIIQGRGLLPASVNQRVRDILNHDRYPPKAFLVIHPGEVDRQRIRRPYTQRPGNPLMHFASISDATTDAESPVWYPPGGDLVATSLKSILNIVETRPPTRIRPPARVRFATVPEQPFLDDLMDDPGFTMTFPQKEAMDRIFDWPMIGRNDLAGISGVSNSSVTMTVNPMLNRLGMVNQVGDPKAMRYATSDTGLDYIARRDRTKPSTLKKKYSSSRDPETGSFMGSAMRALDRTFTHTDGIMWFIGRMAGECAASSGRYRLQYIEPAGRVFRHYEPSLSSDEKRPSIQPDAGGLLVHRGRSIPFLLEFEHRAVRPSRVFKRIRPYHGYMVSGAPLQDYGIYPLVLVVFEDLSGETAFFLEAQKVEQESGIVVPFAVTHVGEVERLGALGPIWRLPSNPSMDGRTRMADITVSTPKR